jgi:hypothetical protein
MPTCQYQLEVFDEEFIDSSEMVWTHIFLSVRINKH